MRKGVRYEMKTKGHLVQHLEGMIVTRTMLLAGVVTGVENGNEYGLPEG